MRSIDRYSLHILTFSWLLFACNTNDSQKNDNAPKAPVAIKIPHTISIHGLTLTDDYFWLKEKDNPEVIDYLKAENAYTDKIMQHTLQLQQTLFEELKGKIKEDDRSVPVKIENYFYYTRTEKGQQYKIYCRRKDAPRAKEEILLDANQLAKGKPYFSIGDYEISPDQQFLAYTTDTTGSENFTLYIKNLYSGKYLEDQIPGLSYSLEWANDNQTIFYTTRNEAHRPYKLFRHKIGTPYQEDMQEYHEEDERFYLSVDKTKDEEYLIINLESQTTSEVRFLSANKPNESFTAFIPREQDVEYKVFSHQEDFYILTNKDAVNYKLMKTPKGAIEQTNWYEIIPHNKNSTIENIDVFADYLAIFKRENGMKQISIMNFQNNDRHLIEFPEPVYVVYPEENPDFSSHKLRFEYSSLITPASVFEYNMKDGSRELLKQDEILGNYDSENYSSERVFATADDGTQIPISLVYRKGIAKDGNNPLYLYGYGSYGSITNPYFSSNRLSLLDRGFIYAIAHIRGSGDMGEKWYLNGKLQNKKNTFTDFIDCAEYLIQEKYTDSTKLVAMGGSAGGLLMGAVANMNPELFEIIVAHVPFVDVINTMLDEAIPLTVIEYEEWGNPNQKEAFNYMYSYSPYNNVQQKDYPNMLTTAGLNDPRVGYWEPAKWTAKLRAMKTDTNRLLLKTNMGAGHGGPSGRYNHLREVAFEYAFILDVLGLKKTVPIEKKMKKLAEF